MSISSDDLNRFHQFADEKLRTAGAESMDELFDLWRIEHPSPEEQAEIDEAIREGLADIAAGRYRPAEDVSRDMRRKYNLPKA
jgi:predicted transcriptional regulator